MWGGCGCGHGCPPVRPPIRPSARPSARLSPGTITDFLVYERCTDLIGRLLEDAAEGQFQEMDRERMSCILGVTSGQELLGAMVSRLQRPVWQKALREAGLPESKVLEVCDRISDEIEVSVLKRKCGLI